MAHKTRTIDTQTKLEVTIQASSSNLKIGYLVIDGEAHAFTRDDLARIGAACIELANNLEFSGHRSLRGGDE